MDKKIVEFVKKYKLHILVSLLVIFVIRSCSNSNKVTKLERINGEQVKMIDSIKVLNKKQIDSIINFSDIVRVEKLKIHREYDNYISERDRGQQLMELHKIVKDKIKELEK